MNNKKIYVYLVFFVLFLFLIVFGWYYFSQKKPIFNDFPPLPDLSTNIQQGLENSNEPSEFETSGALNQEENVVISAPSISQQEESDKIILQYVTVRPSPIISVGKFYAIGYGIENIQVIIYELELEK